MSRAGFVGFGGVHDDFGAWKVSREGLAAGLRFAAAVGRDQVGFLQRLVQAGRGIGRFLGVAKVQTQLIGVGKVTFATREEAFLPELEIIFLG